MLILHAFWSPDTTADFIQYGAFRLWAETLAVARPGRTREDILPHPFQLPAKDWPAFWGTLGFPEAPRALAMALETHSLLLPSGAEGPLPSPALARYWPTEFSVAEARLRPWRLDCLRLDRPIRQLGDIHFLAFQRGGAVQPAGDFLFWYWFTQEIKRLLVRDQYLPALVVRQPPRPKGGRKDPPLEILGGWEWAGEPYEQLIARAVERLPPAAVCPLLDGAAGPVSGARLSARGARGPANNAQWPVNGGEGPAAWPEAESLLRHCAEVLLDQMLRQLVWPAVFTKKVTASLLESAIAPRPTSAPWIGTDQVRQWRQWRGHLRGTGREVAFTLGFQLEEPPLGEPAGVTAVPAGAAGTTTPVAKAAGTARVEGAAGTARVAGTGGTAGTGGVAGAVITASDPGDGWTLHFVAIPRDDPSRRLSLADYWSAGQPERGAWRRQLGEDFETQLLLNLGLAARMVPQLWAGLATATPQGLNLTLDEAFAFLKEWAWILEAAGYKIIIPAWWTPQGRRRVKIRLRTAPSQAKPSAVASGEGGLKLKNLVQYRYELAIGDEVVSPEEWRQLVESKVPLVRFRGQWVELDRDKMREMLAFWQRHGQEMPEMSIQDLLQRTAIDEDFEVDRDDALAGMLERLRGGHLEPVADPPGLRAQLRDYQKRGVAWLRFLEQCGLGACLADDMGLGKTLQAIARLVQERAEEGEGLAWEATGYQGAAVLGGSRAGDAVAGWAPSGSKAGSGHAGSRAADTGGTLAPTLLIAPTSVIGNWHKEVQKFAPQLPVLIHHGATRTQDKADFLAQTASQALVITSYALARRDQALFTARDWHRVILDEAQNIKNPLAAQTKAILKLRAPHRLALTGTPVENRLIDLWSIFNFLNPGYLDTQARFRKGFEIPVQRDRDPVKTATLKRLVEPFILRRLKRDKAIIRDLPDKLEALQYCNLSKEQAALYETVVRDVERQLADKEGIARQGLMLSTLMKLKQICNHPAQFLQDGSPFIPERSHKLQRLQEMLEEAMAEGDSVLIFSQFTEVAAALERRLRQELRYPTFYLHGGTPRAKREDMIAAFQDPEAEPAIFVLSLKAGGVGITLTKANHVFHFDRWWNPAVEDQASDRAFRIGQEKTVFVHKFVTLGTLEERISDMIEDKKAIAGAIVGNDESWLTQLDNERFKALIRLNRAAVVE